MNDPFQQVGFDRNLDRARRDGDTDLDSCRFGLLLNGLDRVPTPSRASLVARVRPASCRAAETSASTVRVICSALRWTASRLAR